MNPFRFDFVALLSVIAAHFLSASFAEGRSAELRVHTEFEGGSARIESVDQVARVVRLQPGGDPQRGWPCWWSLRVEGVAKGERLMLDVGGSDRTARNNGVETGKPLGGLWAMPGRAALS